MNKGVHVLVVSISGSSRAFGGRIGKSWLFLRDRENIGVFICAAIVW